MKLLSNTDDFLKTFETLCADYNVYGPVSMASKGKFSDTHSTRYTKIGDFRDLEWEEKSHFSPKEVMMPPNQVLFYFTEDDCSEPSVDEKPNLVFMRACDIHAMRRLDEIYLNNGPQDSYYKKLREKTKFILIGCQHSFRNCFCVSMGTNEAPEYSMAVKPAAEGVYVHVPDDEQDLKSYFDGVERDFEMDVVQENDVRVTINDSMDLAKVENSNIFDEYHTRCVACGTCNFVCPTCTCFSMQDIVYTENKRNGERRRVWASCQVDGYTDLAGGNLFRKKNGERMRFKVMHKVNDFKKRFGYHMCVGCGRCDDACPEYISFSTAVNKLSNHFKQEDDNQ